MFKDTKNEDVIVFNLVSHQRADLLLKSSLNVRVKVQKQI